MIPVPGLAEVKVAWVFLKKEGRIVLYGFLFYSDADRPVVDYISDGMSDLDVLPGDSCTIFLIESPSERWIGYAKQNDHTWWKLFGKYLEETTLAEMRRNEKPRKPSRFTLIQNTIIQNISDASIVVGDDNVVGSNNVVSLAHILWPKISLLYNRNEAYNVAKHFGVTASELPCLIFFKDFDGKVVWKEQLEQYDTQRSLKTFFREFFEGEDFKSMLAPMHTAV